jgi:Salmonella virulence plasmid 65kDa B protein.
LGWNWDLTGISAITRTGGKFYYDGYVSPVNYNDDRFCLDGQRLLNVSNNEYGANETQYRTEQDQLSKIVSYTEPDINGPAYFKVWTADGRILTYGNTSDSRALISSSNHVNVWLLKSVYDHYGNYITYHYETTADSYRLSQIEYSGNDPDEISPSFTVYFIYDNREDIDMVYHGDCMLKENVLLRYISVYNCDQHMFLYKFNFQAPDPQNGYPHPLLTSIEFKAKKRAFEPYGHRMGRQ